MPGGELNIRAVWHDARIVASQMPLELRRRQFRSDAVTIDGHHRAVFRLDKDGTLAAGAETHHLHHRGGEHGSNSGVHRVAAFFQNAQVPALRHQGMAGSHDVAAPGHQRLQAWPPRWASLNSEALPRVPKRKGFAVNLQSFMISLRKSLPLRGCDIVADKRTQVKEDVCARGIGGCYSIIAPFLPVQVPG